MSKGTAEFENPTCYFLSPGTHIFVNFLLPASPFDSSNSSFLSFLEPTSLVNLSRVRSIHLSIAFYPSFSPFSSTTSFQLSASLSFSKLHQLEPSLNLNLCFQISIHSFSQQPSYLPTTPRPGLPHPPAIETKQCRPVFTPSSSHPCFSPSSPQPHTPPPAPSPHPTLSLISLRFSFSGVSSRAMWALGIIRRR